MEMKSSREEERDETTGHRGRHRRTIYTRVLFLSSLRASHQPNLTQYHPTPPINSTAYSLPGVVWSNNLTDVHRVCM